MDRLPRRLSLDLDRKVTCYLSAEFLMGPQLGNNLLNLRIEEEARAALAELGQDLDTVLACEEEPGLGNGGLGRLAACYLDSLATLERPAIGYGIRYEFGIFDQEIHDGWQVEKTDNWLVNGNPWEIAKPDLNYQVNWGGHTEHYVDDAGHDRVALGTASGSSRGLLRHTDSGLRRQHLQHPDAVERPAVESFALDAFNAGDYYKAVEDEVISETVTKVLYPNDEPEVGKQLRLLQQYFFVSCSLQDILHIWRTSPTCPPERSRSTFAVQLNDTHPSIGVAELMRLLVDERHLDWDEAWAITVATFGYTNHTLLPEALETWPLAMFGEFLPRHLEIIYEINRRFLDEVRARFPGDEERVRRMSLIGEDGGKSVRMAHLATVGQPRHQRRRRAALRTVQSQCAQGLLRDVAGAVQQQDQRRDAASLPGAGQPWAARTARRHDRRRLADGPGEPSRARIVRRRRRVPSASGVPSSAPTRRGSPTTFARRPASN